MSETNAPEIKEVTKIAGGTLSVIDLSGLPDTVCPVLTERTATLARVSIQDSALARFGDWREHAKVLIERYRDVAFDTKTTKGYKDACEARAAVRAPRFAANKMSVAIKADLRVTSSAVGMEAEQITKELAETEDHIHAQIKAEDDRQAAEKIRTDNHKANLKIFSSYAPAAEGQPSAAIEQAILAVSAVEIGDSWEEFAVEAQAAKDAAIEGLRLVCAKSKAAEDKVIEDERVRLENESRALVIKALGEIQSQVMECFNKPTAFISARIEEIKASPNAAPEAAPEVSTGVTNALIQLGQILAAAQQQELMAAQLAALQAPAPVIEAAPCIVDEVLPEPTSIEAQADETPALAEISSVVVDAELPEPIAEPVSLVTANNRAKAAIAAHAPIMSRCSFAPAPAPAPAATPVPQSVPADADLVDGIACLKLGAIVARLAGLGLTSSFITETLSIPHHEKVKSATYWRLDQLPSIKAALLAHIEKCLP